MTKGAHTWNKSREDYLSLNEHIDEIERSRAIQGIHQHCPILEFFRAAPNNDLEDVMIAEAFVNSHPHWGADYLGETIRMNRHFKPERVARIVQLNATHDLFTHHTPGQVVRTLHTLLAKPDLVFLSKEAPLVIHDWTVANHRNPKAFLSQDHVRRHMPTGHDMSKLKSPDFPHLQKRGVKVVGENTEAGVTEQGTDTPYELPMEWIRSLHVMGTTAVAREMALASRERRLKAKAAS